MIFDGRKSDIAFFSRASSRSYLYSKSNRDLGCKCSVECYCAMRFGGRRHYYWSPSSAFTVRASKKRARRGSVCLKSLKMLGDGDDTWFDWSELLNCLGHVMQTLLLVLVVIHLSQCQISRPTHRESRMLRQTSPKNNKSKSMAKARVVVLSVHRKIDRESSQPSLTSPFRFDAASGWLDTGHSYCTATLLPAVRYTTVPVGTQSILSVVPTVLMV